MKCLTEATLRLSRIVLIVAGFASFGILAMASSSLCKSSVEVDNELKCVVQLSEHADIIAIRATHYPDSSWGRLIFTDKTDLRICALRLEVKKRSLYDHIYLMSSLQELGELSIVDPYFDSDLVTTLRVAAKVRILSLKGSDISDDGVGLLADVTPGLEELDLAQCFRISDQVSGEIRKFRNLKAINITMTGVHEKGIDEILQHPGIRVMVVDQDYASPERRQIATRVGCNLVTN